MEFNGGRIPFASATIGLGFRNEISPRSGLLRVREFSMAEIEHYVDPTNKSHYKFKNIKDLKIPLLTKDLQEAHLPPFTDMTIGEAVSQKIIDNETLAYFVARTYLFMMKIGINKDGIRARQHLKTEMAHYASDCWDIEIETSYGWIEAVGHADRTCYDLTSHSKSSGVELVAHRKLKEPVINKFVRVAMNKGSIFKTLGKEQSKVVLEKLEKLTDDEKETLMQEFEKNGKTVLKLDDKTFDMAKDLVWFERQEEKQLEEKFVPGVIEPAFGIGRIVYCVLEHCFRERVIDGKIDDKRTFFAFPPLVAPVKVSILPLIDDEKMRSFIEPLSNIKIIIYIIFTFYIGHSFVSAGISYKIDDVADNIGRR